MKIFGVSRASAACVGIALFAWAQASAFCQTGALPSAPQVVVTRDEAFLVGATQMVASANANFTPNPQGRYALVTQQERSLPPGPLLGNTTTGAMSLFLYDARLNKTRVLLQRRADGGKHTVDSVHWIAQTDCALVVVRDVPPPDSAQGSSSVDVNNDLTDTYGSEFFVNGKTVNATLLFYDFSKSLTPRVLGTSADGFFISVSPIKPFFVVWSDKSIRMGSAPGGALGPARELSPRVYFDRWNQAGTAIYEEEYDYLKDATGTQRQRVEHWFEWDGKSPDAVALKTKPTKAMIAQKPTPAPLPITLQIGALPVPANLSRSRILTEERDVAFAPATPQTAPVATKPVAQTKPPAQTPKSQTGTVFHPLYLAPNDSAEASASPGENAALLAPDAPGGAILADQSAVLYQSGGAVYATPLVRVKTAAYAALRKQRAMQQGKQVGLGILMYVQDYDEEYPLSDRFEEGVSPYLRDPSMFSGFTFQRPTAPLAKIPMPATTVMGYVTVPGGRAVVYVDGHVKWEDMP